MSLGMRSDQYCMTLRDVDECALGLHNCSKIAECTNLEVGYTCKCPADYIDGNPEVVRSLLLTSSSSGGSIPTTYIPFVT